MELKNLKTSFLGKNIIEFESLDSTQKYAKKLSEKQNGLLIIADYQTKGIGTHDRIWYTGKGKNIAMTFILEPKCNVSKLTRLTVIIAECMIKAIDNIYNIKLQIKEPNDIMINNKKIGGILTEAILEGEIAKTIYIGIGFNVNQEEFPIELENIASSLKKQTRNTYIREDIISEFLNIFESEYLKIINN